VKETILKVDCIPCHCGALDASWHGSKTGVRTYSCAKCWSVDPHNHDRLIMRIGKPIHFRPTNANMSACGLEHPEFAAYDGRDVDCILCIKTKAWRRYVGFDQKVKTKAKGQA